MKSSNYKNLDNKNLLIVFGNKAIDLTSNSKPVTDVFGNRVPLKIVEVMQNTAKANITNGTWLAWHGCDVNHAEDHFRWKSEIKNYTRLVIDLSDILTSTHTETKKEEMRWLDSACRKAIVRCNDYIVNYEDLFEDKLRAHDVFV